ncbi:MAG: amidohydrolase, partial [Gammaproteobacteria bacterium]|nr:amidohydrolase [Gammaproteobacteria bacterium]
MKIIDFRVRPPARSFPSIDVYPRLGQQKSPNWGWYCTLPPSVQQRSMDAFMAENRAAGVTHAVIWGRASVVPGQSTPHEDVAAIAREHAPFFSAFGGVAFRGSIADSLAEVDGAASLGFKGITVEPGWAGAPDLYADDPKLYPIYQRAQERGLILAFTISARMGTDLSYTSPEPVDRVAGDFPRLKIVISHSFWPCVEHSCGLAFRRPNIHLLPDLYGWSMPGYTKWIDAANTFLSDRMIFGSAYPLMGTKDIVE